MTIQVCLANTYAYDLSEASILSLPFGDEEICRLQKIGNPTAREQSLAALLALGTLLEKNGISPLPIARQAEGKPYFMGETTLQFNLSHSDALAAAALASAPVGIDLEFLREERDTAGIAKRFFTESEREEWESAPTADHFFALWTRKEARAKLHGKSLLSGEPSDRVFFLTYRLLTPNGTAFVSLATEERTEHVEWILPSQNITVEPYQQ